MIHDVCTEQDSFVTWWLNLIHLVRSVSIDKFDKIKDRIKRRKTTDYEGENIESIAADFLADWRDLHGARMYNQSLTMVMLNTILQSCKSSESAEDFRHPLRQIKAELNTKLLEVRHMSYAEAHSEMMRSDLDVQSVLKIAKEEYRALFDDDKWPAATHAKDSKAVSKSYGNVNKAATAELKNIVNALVQSANNGRKPKADKFGKDKRKFPNSSNKSDRNNPKGSGTNKFNKRGTKPQGRTPPPKAGESEIKFIGGKKHYWCAKCNRWTLTHGTESHKTREQLQKEHTPSSRHGQCRF